MTDTQEQLTAAVATRSESVTARATEHGHLVDVRIDPRELQFGGTELASTILQLCHRAAESARATRRTLLADEGVSADVLDRLGLPTQATVAASENRILDTEAEPTSWLRQV